MKFVPAKCPNCGAEIQVDEGMTKGFCQYCGSSFFIEDAKNLLKEAFAGNNRMQIENLVNRACQFFNEKDFDRAEEYCNKVLDMDTQNERAKALLKELNKIIRKPNVIVSCLDPSSSSTSDSIYVDGKRQNQKINPYGALTLPVGTWTICVSTGITSKNVQVEIRDNCDEYEIKYKRRLFGTDISVIKLR